MPQSSSSSPIGFSQASQCWILFGMLFLRDAHKGRFLTAGDRALDRGNRVRDVAGRDRPLGPVSAEREAVRDRAARSRPTVLAGERAEVVARNELAEPEREARIVLQGRVPELDERLVGVVNEAVVEAVAITLLDEAHVERHTAVVDDAGDDGGAHGCTAALPATSGDKNSITLRAHSS